MNSIMPNIYQNKPGLVQYHHHTIEIILPEKTAKGGNAPPTTTEKIKNVIADILIILGTLMALVAGTALTLQTAGVGSPMLSVLSNLFMPSVAAVLTGFQLSQNQIRANAQLRLATGVPGITIGA